MNFFKCDTKIKNCIFFILSLSVSLLWAGQYGVHVERMIKNGSGNFANGKFAKTFKRIIQGKEENYAFIFIVADKKAIPVIKSLGIIVNTITPNGIMTAIAPVNKLHTIALIKGVHRIEAGSTVKMFMDQSSGYNGVNLPNTTYPRQDNTGNGVIIGFIDTGIDIEHPDFFDNNGNTRIVSIWDHTLDPEDVDSIAHNPQGFSYGTEWNASIIQQGYEACLHRDKHGHGTHVAGTAAGNGKARSYHGPYTGLAPESEILIVKFDFNNEKNRNSSVAILDAVNWIFQKATAEGKPCVINMSLGSDYGPHDGTTAGELGIDGLSGENKIVCVAAGNAGSSYDGEAFNTWGGPIHGSGNLSTRRDIVFETSSDYTPGTGADYIFFDIWYPGSVKCRIQITTPSGRVYPPYLRGIISRMWWTDGKTGGYNTPEGFLYVENLSSANSFWNTNNGDNCIYIEISDYSSVEPASGKWKVEIIPILGIGSYQSWHGYSGSLRQTYFWYNSGTTNHSWGDIYNPYLSNNAMTIGKPATAHSVISVGAYQTKNEWPARLYDDCTNPSSEFELIMQAYGISPIDYYDPFYMYDLAFFSSQGPSRDNRIQPLVTGPGVGIVASLSQTARENASNTYYRCTNRVEYEGGYTTLQGTSMSCPHAAGAVALLLEEASKQGLSPTPADIKKYLAQECRTDEYTGNTPNNLWGYGKIDVSNSLEVIQPPGQ